MPQTAVQPLRPHWRPRRKKAMFASGALACLLTPFLILQIVLYRANLATARESFPKAPTLRATDRLLVLAPHCDDETLGAGGTIAEARRRGIAVRLVFLTNGDGSRSTQIAVDASEMRNNSFQQLAKLRQNEAIKAAAALGVDEKNVVFLGYPDGGTKELWLRHWNQDNLYRSNYTRADHVPYANARTQKAPYCGAQVLKDVQGAISDFQPTVVITTHPDDTHPDHQASYEFARAALEQLQQNKQAVWAKNINLFTFIIHHGLWPAPYGYNPQAALAPPAVLMKTGSIWMQESLDSTSRQAKKRALECYRSQLAFTPRYLRSFLRRNELFAVLPAQNLPAKNEKSAAKTSRLTARSIVLDASRDSLWHQLIPAADLQDLALLPLDKTPSKNITLRLQAMKAPAKQLHYRLWVHNIGAQNVEVTQCDFRFENGAWKAFWRSDKNTQELPLRVRQNGFEMDVPRAKLQGAMLFSAESFLRDKRLDATGTGVLHIPPF